jgi:hypothetical protein
MPKEYSNHFILPDCQIRPGVPMEQLTWAGNYAASKHPDRIICIGDFWDFPSLSSYDVGKKAFEGRTYLADIEAGMVAMEMFLNPIRAEIERCNRNHRNRWAPTFDFFSGNHEFREIRAVEADRKLEGLVGRTREMVEQYGWKFHPFLEVEVLDGVAYSHYFTTGVLGRPVTSARAMILKKHMSCVMGHVQKRDIAYDYTGNGKQITGIFAGSFNQHDEDYLGAQGNHYWKGIWVLNNVRQGEFDEKPVSLRHLSDKYRD